MGKVEIKLSGGVYDGKVFNVPQDIYDIGALEIIEPLPTDIDLASGCYNLKTIKYAKSINDSYVWEEQHE